jgi:hypothetical protein
VDVTSIMSTVGGGFVTSLSSGQMIGSDDGFNLATLPSAQYAGEGAWLGTPAGVFTAKQVAAVLTNPRSGAVHRAGPQEQPMLRRLSAPILT